MGFAGESVSGQERNERQIGRHGHRASLHRVREQRSVGDMWAELGLEETWEIYSEGALSGDSQLEGVGWEE